MTPELTSSIRSDRCRSVDPFQFVMFVQEAQSYDARAKCWHPEGKYNRGYPLGLPALLEDTTLDGLSVER